MGWTVRVFPFMEELDRWNTIRGLRNPASTALADMQPGQLMNTGNFGNNEIFRSPVQAFVCPSSELGSQSPDSYGFDAPSAAVTNGAADKLQAALHYRGNMGAHGYGDVTGSQARYNFVTSGVIYPRHTRGVVQNTSNPVMPTGVRISEITDGTSKTLLFGETSSTRGRNAQWPLGGAGYFGIFSWPSGCDNFEVANNANLGTGGVAMYDAKAVRYSINSRSGYDVHTMRYSSAHPGGAQFAMADGSVVFLSDATALSLLINLAVRNDDKSVSVP